MIAARHTTQPDVRARLLAEHFHEEGDIYTRPDAEGYWSNIGPQEQAALLAALADETRPVREVVAEALPHLRHYVYEPLRSAGLELLDIQPHQTGIDYGCMWGNVLVAAARQCHTMAGVDKTKAHLQFLRRRLADEGLGNVVLIHRDLRKGLDLEGAFDFALVNGVLEWIPAGHDITIEDYFERRTPRFVRPRQDPRQRQLAFLRMAYRNLKPGGKLYLAIENRYDYQYFLWKRDPHSRLFGTALLPRALANLVYNLVHGRPYVYYLYSHRALRRLLRSAGFSEVERYAVFPSYRYPRVIVPFTAAGEVDLSSIYREAPTRSVLKKTFRAARRGLDRLLYGKLRLWSLAPSFIFIARK